MAPFVHIFRRRPFFDSVHRSFRLGASSVSGTERSPASVKLLPIIPIGMPCILASGVSCLRLWCCWLQELFCGRMQNAAIDRQIQRMAHLNLSPLYEAEGYRFAGGCCDDYLRQLISCVHVASLYSTSYRRRLASLR
jgi:hypothetical protein